MTVLNLCIHQDYSVVLVIPDYYDRLYVETLARILLTDMGFKQLCAQQVLVFASETGTRTDMRIGIASCDLRRRDIERLRGRHGCSQDQHCLRRRRASHRRH